MVENSAIKSAMTAETDRMAIQNIRAANILCITFVAV